MTGLEVEFTARLGDFQLAAGFRAPGSGVTALFGQSGSGKTTLLRCIAGLEPAEGTLRVNGELWHQGHTGIPVHRRALGYVFQEASLFAHLSVRRNLEFGWRRSPLGERRVGFEEAVEWLGIGALLTRSPGRLSGGERQRVAIARALLTSPRLLLMDEPLAALDEKSKREILPFLERLHAELAIPVLYVSHSLKEVARLADHMVWLDGGRVRAAGPLTEVLARFDLEAAEEGEAGAVVEATVTAHDRRFHLTALDSGWGRLWVSQLQAPIGHRARVRLPARDISLSLEPDRASSILNVWEARVDSVQEVGPGQALVRLCTPIAGGEPMVMARITRRSVEALRLAPGAKVYARIKSVALME